MPSWITTEPSALVEPIPDRMLAVLDLKEALEFLHGATLPIHYIRRGDSGHGLPNPLEEIRANVQDARENAPG